mgnify:CR=1 FL=1
MLIINIIHCVFKGSRYKQFVGSLFFIKKRIANYILQWRYIGIKWAHVPTCFSDYFKHSYSNRGALVHEYAFIKCN